MSPCQGYRLRETDLRLKQKETNSSSSNARSNIVSAIVESPSKSSITYKDLRLAGYSGTKYDAEMLISQGLADGICQTQQPQPHPVVTARSPSTTVPTATVNTALATAIIEDLPSSLKRGAAPPRQPPPNPPPPPPQVSDNSEPCSVGLQEVFLKKPSSRRLSFSALY